MTPGAARVLARDVLQGRVSSVKAYHKIRKAYIYSSAQLSLSQKQVSNLKEALSNSERRKRKQRILHPGHEPGKVAFFGPEEFEAVRRQKDQELIEQDLAAADKAAATAAKAQAKADREAAILARREAAETNRGIRKARLAEAQDARRELAEQRRIARLEKAQAVARDKPSLSESHQLVEDILSTSDTHTATLVIIQIHVSSHHSLTDFLYPGLVWPVPIKASLIWRPNYVGCNPFLAGDYRQKGPVVLPRGR